MRDLDSQPEEGFWHVIDEDGDCIDILVFCHEGTWGWELLGPNDRTFASADSGSRHEAYQHAVEALFVTKVWKGQADIDNYDVEQSIRKAKWDKIDLNDLPEEVVEALDNGWDFPDPDEVLKQVRA